LCPPGRAGTNRTNPSDTDCRSQGVARPAREKTVKPAAKATDTGKPKDKRADALLWAAFVLSGAGK
jgi:hypothetical protein